MNNEINLMPGKISHTSPNLRKRIILQRISIGLMFIISFLSITLFILIALSPLPSLKQREREEIKRLELFNAMIVKLHRTKDKINQINKILKLRPIYAETISAVSGLLPENVDIEEVHLNNKALSLTIESTSLLSLDQLLERLTPESGKTGPYKKITLVSIKKDFEIGKFVMTIELI